MILVVSSHNPFTKDLFEYDPNIDEVIAIPWELPVAREVSIERHRQASGGATGIHRVYFPEFFDTDEGCIYMSPEEGELVERIRSNGKYIVIHPFAGARRRVCYPMSKYQQVIDVLIDNLGYNVIVVGASYKQSCVGGEGAEFVELFPYNRDKLAVLVNKVSVRVSISLVLGCSGFIGTHSSMMIAAWCKGIRSVCIAPTVHDTEVSWESFFASQNPTTWGSDKEFNKTIIVRNPDDVLTEDIVRWFR